jgi:hypothetical protein
MQHITRKRTLALLKTAFRLGQRSGQAVGPGLGETNDSTISFTSLAPSLPLLLNFTSTHLFCLVSRSFIPDPRRIWAG